MPDTTRVEAKLLRQNSQGQFIPWTVLDDGTEPVSDVETHSRLDEANVLLDAIRLAVSSGVGNGPLAFHHVQALPSAVWVINHNLGYCPGGITIFDTAGTVVEGDIAHPSVNQTVLTFSSAFAGEVFFS